MNKKFEFNKIPELKCKVINIDGRLMLKPLNDKDFIRFYKLQKDSIVISTGNYIEIKKEK